MMRKILSAALAVVVLTGCAGNPSRGDESAQQPAEKSHTGKVVGGAGGAAVGGAMAYSSAGVLCTISGPLCAVIVVPAAIIGGLVGLAAGSVVDTVADTQKKPAREEAAPLADTSPPPGG